MHEIRLLRQAAKDLDKLRGKNFERVRDRILKLADNPRPEGSLKLTAQDGFRIRSGDLRTLYRIDDKKRIVYIYRIKPRGAAY